MELSTSRKGKMEAKMEVSGLELYYSTFGYVFEWPTRVVYGIVAMLTGKVPLKPKIILLHDWIQSFFDKLAFLLRRLPDIQREKHHIAF